MELLTPNLLAILVELDPIGSRYYPENIPLGYEEFVMAPSATTKWISLKALILMPSDKQVLIIVDDECD